METAKKQVDANNIAFLFLLTGIAALPLYTFFEVLNVHTSINLGNTPYYIKAFKDITLLFMTLCWLLSSSRKIFIDKLLLCFYALIVCVILKSLYVNKNVISILCGIRWLWPLVMICFVRNIVGSSRKLEILSLLLLVLFLLGAVLQIIQFLYGLMNAFNWYITKHNWYIVRYSGFCANPNTMATVAMIAMYYVDYYTSVKKKILLRLIVGLSIFFTHSATGIIAFILYQVVMLKQKFGIRWQYMILLLIVCLGLLFANASLVSGRKGNAAIRSFMIRVGILLKVCPETSLISNDFGFYTNTALMLETKTDKIKGKYADSTVTSLVGNLGWLPMAALFLFALKHIIINRDEQKTLHFIILFGCFGLTSIILESYPLNVLLSLETAMLIQETKTRNKTI